MGIDLAPEYATTKGFITSEQVAAIREAGHTFVIIKAPNPYEPGYRRRLSICQQHIQVFAEGGFGISLYCYLYFTVLIVHQVQAALDMVSWARGQGIDLESPQVWLDVEDENAPEAATIIARLGKAVAQCQAAGIELPGIYTRGEYWRRKVGNSTAFSHLPLWDAAYGYQNPNNFVSYGGWVSCAVRQWHNTTSVAGVGVDLNSRWRT